jgi:tRNA uridine 5-carboxymethylaminomethyl modification enzyme
MFTSRAEFRLSLRADNADQRLTARGRAIGCVDDTRWAAFSAKMDQISNAKTRLGAISLSARDIAAAGVQLNADGPRKTALEALALADFGFAQLTAIAPETSDIAPDIQDQVKKDALYAHYILRQEKDVSALERDEAQAIPEDLDYADVRGLSTELAMKLQKTRPTSIAQAGRIEGMTPAALMLLVAAIKRRALAATGT